MNIPPPRNANRTPGKPVKKVRKHPVEIAGDSEISLPTGPNVPSENILDYNFLIYGQKGIGKSSIAAKFPDVRLHVLSEPGRRDIATPIVPKKGEARLTWARFCEYVKLLTQEKEPGRIVIDTLDSVATLCEQHYASLSGQKTLMAMNDNGRTWRAMTDDFTTTFDMLLWAGWRMTLLSHVRVRDRVSRNVARNDLKKAKAEGVVVAEVQPSCSGWAYEFSKVTCSIVGCFVYHGRDRIIHIRGHESMYASPGGSGVGDTHFLDSKTGEPYDAIYAGRSPEEAWTNLCAAWNNEVEGMFLDTAEYAVGG